MCLKIDNPHPRSACAESDVRTHLSEYDKRVGKLQYLGAVDTNMQMWSAPFKFRQVKVILADVCESCYN